MECFPLMVKAELITLGFQTSASLALVRLYGNDFYIAAQYFGKNSSKDSYQVKCNPVHIFCRSFSSDSPRDSFMKASWIFFGVFYRNFSKMFSKDSSWNLSTGFFENYSDISTGISSGMYQETPSKIAMKVCACISPFISLIISDHVMYQNFLHEYFLSNFPRNS